MDKNASTTEAVRAQVQSRGEGELDKPSPVRLDRRQFPGHGIRYRLGEYVSRPLPKLHERQLQEEPLYRPLRIYTIDPATPRLDGAIASVNVPYEPLEPGPVGCLFEVDNYDVAAQAHYQRADLDTKLVLLRSGYEPTPSDPRFHQQMVYAVCSLVYATFRKALGRQLGWRFHRADNSGRLILRPHAIAEANAYYDETFGELRFGYYKAEPERISDTLRFGYYKIEPQGTSDTHTLPGSTVFTCLSHDIIVHELSHALLDGLRSSFREPSGPDVPAFHEAFADLVALFQHFSYPEVVLASIRRSRGDLASAPYLTDLARQLGHTTGKNAALRSGIDRISSEAPCRLYDPNMEAHELGSVLVAAVFEAFLVIFKRKTERYVRLATQGIGILPAGELAPDLKEVLADRASKLAEQFLSIVIRAIDYCPPVDITFGEFLRAMITADFDLVPDDRWAYREALVDAFARRNIYPRFVSSLSEDALLWRPTRKRCDSIEALSFAQLRFAGDPGIAANPDEICRQACALGEFVTRPEYMDEFGLAANSDARLKGDSVDLPIVESIRTSRRVGPNGQIAFDLVAEVTQARRVRGDPRGFIFHGGSTVIIGPKGEIRYVISKSVVGQNAVEERRKFLETAAGSRYWLLDGRTWVPKQNFFWLLD